MGKTNSETAVLKNNNSGAIWVNSESSFHISACPTSHPFSTASTGHPTLSDEQLFRLAAQHTHLGPPSLLETILVHCLSPQTLRNSLQPSLLPYHPPPASILQGLLLLFLAVFLCFSGDTMQITCRYEVLPLPVDRQTKSD